jgi:hypothetical protein
MNEKDILKSSMFNAIFRGNDLITHFTRWAFVYVYKNISEEDKKLMIESESKWKYLIKNIKPKYDFIKTEYKTLSECYEKFK